MRMELLGDTNAQVAVSLDNLAATLRARGDLAGAETLIRNGLNIRRRIYGDMHPDVAESLSSLAVLRNIMATSPARKTCTSGLWQCERHFR